MPFPTKTFRMDREANCLTGGFHEALRRMPKERWRVEDVSGAHVRELVRIDFNGRPLLAGPVTGTLFDATTGCCLSGRARLLGPEVAAAVEATRSRYGWRSGDKGA
jgi:hypothetical protein